MMGLGRIGVQELKEISQQARRHIVPRRPGSILYFATNKSKIRMGYRLTATEAFEMLLFYLNAYTTTFQSNALALS